MTCKREGLSSSAPMMKTARHGCTHVHAFNPAVWRTDRKMAGIADHQPSSRLDERLCLKGITQRWSAQQPDILLGPLCVCVLLPHTSVHTFTLCVRVPLPTRVCTHSCFVCVCPYPTRVCTHTHDARKREISEI